MQRKSKAATSGKAGTAPRRAGATAGRAGKKSGGQLDQGQLDAALQARNQARQARNRLRLQQNRAA